MRLLNFKHLISLFLVLLISIACQAVILGIDLGESYSKSFLLAPGLPFEPVLSSDSKRKDLSAITFKITPAPGSSKSTTIERIYGNSAQAFFVRHPKNSLFYFKPLLGANSAESSISGNTKTKNVGPIDEYLSMFRGIDLVPSKNNRSTVAVSLPSISDDLEKEEYPIEEVVAMYLADIKHRANNIVSSFRQAKAGTNAMSILSGDVSSVAVTTPPHFNMAQRSALKDAIELAGLQLVSFVNDGVSVITNYVSNRQFSSDKPEYHLVYDLGAGSISAALFSVVGSNDNSVIVNVENVAFDENFGGNKLTDIVRSELIDKLVTQHPSLKRDTVVNDPKVMRKLWIESERVKNILSANNQVNSHVESLYEDLDFRATFTRQEFEKLMESKNFVKRALDPIFKAFSTSSMLNKDSQFKNYKTQLNSIIYMGGTTRIPSIQKAISSSFGEDLISKQVNTDEAAALGATLRGVGISRIFKTRNITVVDRSLNEYSATVGKSDLPLFKRGDLANTQNEIIIPYNKKLLSKNGDLTIPIKENGKDIMLLDIKQVEQTLSDQKCSTNDALVKVKFFYSFSHMLEIEDLYIECKSTEPKTESDVKADSTKRVSIAKKIRYPGPRPMGSVSKQNSSQRIAKFDKMDKERQQHDILRNKLEGEIYKIKEYYYTIQDTQEEGNGEVIIPEDLLNNLGQQVEQLMEWLEYESQDSSIEDMKNKRKSVEALRKRINRILNPKEEEERIASTANLFKSNLEQLTRSNAQHKEEHKTQVQKLLSHFTATFLKPEDIQKEKNQETPVVRATPEQEVILKTPEAQEIFKLLQQEPDVSPEEEAQMSSLLEKGAELIEKLKPSQDSNQQKKQQVITPQEEEQKYEEREQLIHDIKATLGKFADMEKKIQSKRFDTIRKVKKLIKDLKKQFQPSESTSSETASAQPSSTEKIKEDL